MKTIFVRYIFLLALLCIGSVVRAEDIGAVKARMEQRLPQIQALKAQGVLGENNRGYLEVRGGAGDAGAVVAAENQDRTVVYAEIAKKTNASADQVGRARALKIAQRSRLGEWVQDEGGGWKKK
jgi:uncharacterized protein YdbL (DUF1318 family)